MAVAVQRKGLADHHHRIRGDIRQKRQRIATLRRINGCSQGFVLHIANLRNCVNHSPRIGGTRFWIGIRLAHTLRRNISSRYFRAEQTARNQNRQLRVCFLDERANSAAAIDTDRSCDYLAGVQLVVHHKTECSVEGSGGECIGRATIAIIIVVLDKRHRISRSRGAVVVDSGMARRSRGRDDGGRRCLQCPRLHLNATLTSDSAIDRQSTPLRKIDGIVAGCRNRSPGIDGNIRPSKGRRTIAGNCRHRSCYRHSARAFENLGSGIIYLWHIVAKHCNAIAIICADSYTCTKLKGCCFTLHRRLRHPANAHNRTIGRKCAARRLDGRYRAGSVNLHIADLYPQSAAIRCRNVMAVKIERKRLCGPRSRRTIDFDSFGQRHILQQRNRSRRRRIGRRNRRVKVSILRRFTSDCNLRYIGSSIPCGNARRCRRKPSRILSSTLKHNTICLSGKCQAAGTKQRREFHC